MAVDLSKIKNPQVRAYIEQKMAAEGGVQEARDRQDSTGMLNAAGEFATDFRNAGKEKTILGNRLADLGKAPQVIEGQDSKFNDFGSAASAAQGLARADKELADLGPEPVAPTIGEEEDPNSSISRMAQEAFNEKHPGKDVSTMSFSQLKSVAPMYADKLMKGRSSRGSRGASGGGQPGKPSIDMQIKEQRLENMQKPKALSGELMKRSDSAKMGLDSVKGMRDALDKGENTFSMIGDNNFTMNATRWEEAIGRMQSGGAISDDEGDRFRGMAPTKWDTAEIQKEKLTWMEKEMTKRLQSIEGAPKAEAPVGDDYDGMSDEELAKALKGP